MPDLRNPLWWNGCTDAISYKRFSSGRQASGNSIARQADLEADYAGEFGLQIIDSFTDAGLSAHDGANSDLGDLRRLLDAAKAGRFRSGTHLLVESFDRLSRREARKAHRLFDDLIDTGLYIHTLGDEQVYWAASLDNDPTRIIISIVIMIRSHDESATKRRRSNANRRIKRERAMTSATASENHVGVPITKIRPAWINIIINKDHERAAYREWHFELDPIKSAGVGQIWEYAAAGWGVIQIASSLNEQKLPTFSGAAVLGARMQVAAEYRRIIETVILNPDRSLTVKIKRRAGDGIQVCYSLTSERIEKWWVVRPDGVELAPRDLFFDSSIPIEQIAEHAARHVRAKSDDLYASNG